MSTNLKPHKAMVLLTIEVNDVLDSGECSGRAIGTDILKEHGLSHNMVVTVTGFDMDNCLQKLKQKIEVFKG